MGRGVCVNDGLKKLLKNGHALFVPMDHGKPSEPFPGLENMNAVVAQVDAAGATAVVMTKDYIKLLDKKPKCAIIMQLVTDYAPLEKVEAAKKLGASGVAVFFAVDETNKREVLETFKQTVADSKKYGLPLLAMAFPKKEKRGEVASGVFAVKIANELGADIVKTCFTGSVESFSKIVSASKVPVVLAGGPKNETEEEALNKARQAVEAGAIGVCFGRNVFQAENPGAMVEKLKEIVFKD